MPPIRGRQRSIERLTDEIERGAREYLERIDAMGGTLDAIENGFIQGEIQNAAYEYQRPVESGERIVVGVNRFRIEGRELAADVQARPGDRAAAGGTAARSARIAESGGGGDGA